MGIGQDAVPIKLWMTVYAKSAMKRTAPPKRIRMERDTDNDAQLELWLA
jgi:hypothetical protein